MWFLLLITLVLARKQRGTVDERDCALVFV